MTTHKIRPKLKKQKKAKLTKQNLKIQKTFYYLPDNLYLSYTPTKLTQIFATSLQTNRRIRLLFLFAKQAKLKAFLSKAVKSSRSSGRVSKENLLCSLIECRLDMLLFRLGFAKTLYQSRQFIRHKKVLVNDVCQKNSFFILTRGDIITFDPAIDEQILKNLATIDNKLSSHFSNVEINYRILKIIFLKQFLSGRSLLKFQERPLNWINGL